MGRVLVTTAYRWSDPAGRAVVQSLSEGLPGWEIRSAALPDRLDLGRAVRGVDAVVVAGGPAFGAPLAGVARLARSARRHGRAVALMGVGVPAVASSGRAARQIGRLGDGADLLIVSDEVAAGLLSRSGATPPFRIGADPVWTLLDRWAGSPSERGGAVTVVVPHPPAARALAVAGRLAALAVDCTVLSWTAGLGVLDLRDALAASGGVAVVCQLHALIAAAAAGVPAVAVGDEPGLEPLARRLRQPWVPWDVDGPALDAAVGATSAAGPPAAAVKAEVALAEEAMRLLRIVLSRGETDEMETLVGLPMGPVSLAW
ncbi:MAG: hypothetical protein JF603_01385 [Acidobacteria bacterium]|nr:hypothetical protein [Acidobacteriota bacterium]